MTKMIGSVALYECDKYDWYASACSGIVAGLIDVFFVGAPGEGSLTKLVDEQTDNLVKKCAEWCGWDPKSGEGSIASAIGFLERKFPVPYDMSYATYGENGFNMAAKNHHIKSLAHSPDPIGLIFSIIDQFYGQGTFISDGKIIVVRSESYELQGGNFIAKVFSGFCNWLGHLISDVAGSSGGRGSASGGRGSGIPMPFYNLFLLCDFGSFQVGKDRHTLAELMTRVFQEGYDLRHGAAMSIPVILNELFIRVFWAIKRHYYHELDWKDCMPSIEHSRSLHQMVLAGNAGLCIVDGIDAYIRSGGNMLTFVLRLNLVAWGRLLVLIWKYLCISKAKMEFERNHIKSQAVIKALEKDTLEFQNNVKEFLESQQLMIAKNMTIVIRSLSVNDFNATGDALNNITLLFGGEPQFKTLVEFDKFMSDPNTTLELC